jgi:hypothetical protein
MSLASGQGSAGSVATGSEPLCVEDLAALAAQSSDLAILEKQVAGREIEFWLDLKL